MSRCSAAPGITASQRPINAATPRLVVIAAAFALLRGATLAGQPVAGQNINMVSGTQWPGGDPFLQRQNEPSLAVSSRNPLHLLAGANDYRTVDLPTSDTVPGSLAGDAWLGVFKSFDGGLSWQSYLHPGYPQDQSAAGLASGLKAYNAAADPTVRAGTGGVFYYSGIAFNRGTNIGTVFVSTFFDTNQKENGAAPQGTDAIRYQSTTLVDTGTSGQFLDKTWIAVDIPRSGSGTCTFTGLTGPQAIKAGNVYLVWSRFTGSQSTKIMLSRSLDCGKTWSTPIKLSESSSLNQGTNLAIDPSSGKVYAAWRQFATSSNADSILVARSDDFGMTFPSKNTSTVATIAPFDQAMSGTRFRTNALPSIAASVDAGGNGRVHVAWAQRTGASQDARIVVSTSSNSGKSWSAPTPVDSGPLLDDSGNQFSRGHQFMPQLTFAAGRLMVVYYDQRLDHTLSLFQPTNPFVPDAQGRFYLRTQAFRGELEGAGGANQVFTLFIDDDATILTKRRHTVDLRAAEAMPAANPSFVSASVSQYRMGLWAMGDDGIFRDDENEQIGSQPPDHLYQLQVNAPNLPMFSQGTVPFLGDYIDVSGQTFAVNPATGLWTFNTSASAPPVFFASWTDNRDVVPPIDPNTGFVDWSKYTPPASATNLGDGTSASILDPTQKVPLCQNAFTGSRNQNIYLSRITEGLLVGSPQDAKPLLPAPKQRAFVVTVQNMTAQDRVVTLSIAPGPGVSASFQQGSSALSLTGLSVGSRSGIARPVFASSANAAGTLTVNVTETTPLCNPCLSGSVILNPEGSVTPLAQPDGSTVDVGSVEVYTPSFAIWNPDNNSGNPDNPNPYVNVTNPNVNLLNPNISNPNISNPNISNADPAIYNIANPNISNPNISNPNISNVGVANVSPAIQSISNPNISNPNISNTTAANPNISNPNISNPNISNPNISNAPYTDANYAVVNTGNTTHSYRIALYGNNPNAVPLKVVATKNSQTPVAVGCTLQSLPQSTVLTEADGNLAGTLADATNPDIADGSANNATVSIAPGETVFLTLRGQLSHDDMVELTRHLTPVITAHGANTGAAFSDFALLLSIQTAGGTTLPAAVVGTPYSTTLQAVGGTAPVTWTLVSGSLPDGLTLVPGGTISGTPSGSGTFTFTIQVADSTPVNPQTASQTFQLSVAGRKTTTSVSLAPVSVLANQSSTATVTVTDTESTGTAAVPAGTVTVGGAGVTGGACNLSQSAANQSTCTAPVTAAAAGSYPITASYPADAVHQASSGGANLTVTALTTSTGIGFSSPTVVVGQPSTVTVTVTNTAAGATTAPTGSVTFSSSVPTDTFNPTASCALSSGGGTAATCSVSVTAASASPHVITANYAGVSGVFQTSTTTLTLQVSKRGTTTSVSVSPNPGMAGQAATVSVTVTDVEAAGTKSSPSGTVSFSSTSADSFGSGASCALVAGAAGVSSCSVTVTGTAVGARTISASYAGSGAHLASGGSGPWSVRGNSVTAVTSDTPDPSASGQSVTVSVAVTAAAPAAGTPTGSVTITVNDGTAQSCVASLTAGAGSCSLTLTVSGSWTLTATYSGDANFNSSVGAAPHTVTAPYTFIGFVSPLSTAGTLTSPSNSGTGNFSKGLPIKWQLKNSSGTFVTSLTSTQTLQATYYVGGACTPGAATGSTFLLYMPTSGATGGSTFRYDANNNQFLFNWSTKAVTTGAGCYEIILQLNDGSAPKATQILLQ